jgi:hypothetical protein
MKKGYPVGHAFYKKKGFRTITVHLPKDLHSLLKKYAESEDRSLEKTIKKLIEEKLKV